MSATPTLTGFSGSWTYVAPAHGVKIQARSCRLHSDGRLTATLRFSSETTGLRIPGSGVVNLAASTTRARLAKDLEESFPIGSWTQILDDLYLRLEDALSGAEPATEITPSVESLRVRYLVEPLLPEGVPTILYGLGGVGKGWLALLLARAVITGEVPKGIPWTVSRTGPVLYCDWETSEEDFRSRWTRVAGPGTGHKIVYRRCTRPLAEDLDYTVELVAEADPALVVVDSAGLAAGGDLYAAESPVGLFRALRALNRTALIIAHAPKATGDTVYGSAYFTNLARSVWEVRSQADPDGGELILGLAQRKTNVDRLQRPLGLALRIGETVEVRPAELAGTGVEEMETLAARIRWALRDGAKTVAEVADLLGRPQGTVRKELHRLYGRGRVTRLHDGRWGLASEVDDEARF